MKNCHFHIRPSNIKLAHLTANSCSQNVIRFISKAHPQLCSPSASGEPKKMAPLPPHSTADAPRAANVSSTGLLPSAFFRLPFFFPLPPPRPSVLDHSATSRALGHHFAFFSAAERCVKAFSTSLFEHPLLKPLINIVSEFQHFSQVRKSMRNLRILLLLNSCYFL